MNTDVFDTGDFLAHHGVIGMRWGVRRYQNKDGSLTAAGRRRYGASKAEGVKKYVVKKQQERATAKASGAKKSTALSKEQLAELEAQKRVMQRQKTMEMLRDNPKKLPKYRNQLTKEEADELIANIQFDRKLKDVRREEIRRGMRKVDDLKNDIGTVANLLNNSKTLYNNVAEITNSMADAGVLNMEGRLPTIGGAEGGKTYSRKTLFDMSPEDVLKNSNRWSNSDLNAYKQRQEYEAGIRKYTQEAQKKAAEEQKKAAESGNTGDGKKTNGGGSDNSKTKYKSSDDLEKDYNDNSVEFMEDFERRKKIIDDHQ